MSEWAHQYVGIPWKAGGRTRDGADCFGLVRMALEEHGGLRLPIFDTVGATDLMRVYDEIEAHVGGWRHVPKGNEQPFDVARILRAFRHEGRYVIKPVHMGLIIGGGRILHAEPDGAAGAVISNIEDMRSRIDAVLRHESMCAGWEGPAGSPFDCRRLTVEPGMRISDLVRLADIDDATLTFAEVWIGGTRVDREWWDRIRPKPGAKVWIVVVPQGGGGARIAAMVGVIALSVGVGIGVGVLTGNPMAGYMAGSAVMSIGMLAVNKFLPPPVTKPPAYEQAKQQTVNSLSGGSNQRKPGGVVPVLLGRVKFMPDSGGTYPEIRGQQVYLHAIFVLSLGPVTDPDIFIGETNIKEIPDVTVRFDRGWHPRQMRDRGQWNPNAGFPAGGAGSLPGDRWTATRDAGRFKKGDIVVYNGLGPLNVETSWDVNPGRGSDMYPADAVHEPHDAALIWKEAVVRSTAINTDRITAHFTSPSLGMANSKGKYENYSIKIQIYDAPVEKPEEWRLVIGEYTMTAGAGGPKETFGSHSWDASGASPSGKYNVRYKRVSNPNSTVDNQVWSEVSLTGMTSFANRPPVPPGIGASTLTMVIKASEQLSGTLSNVSCISQSLLWDWNDGAKKWEWGPSSNPAAIARWIYQMPHWPQPIPDAGLDLPRFQEIAAFDRRNNLEFNAWIDFEIGSVADFISDIGVSGFFARCRHNGKRSIVLDPVEATPLPRRIFVDGVNCWNARTTDALGEELHAVRVNIQDAEEDWTAAERLIYADGYDASTAKYVEDRTFVGLTDRKQATLLGRMAIAETTLRREVTEIVTNIQGLSCDVGDCVAYASDDIAVGTARGRIKAVLLSDDGLDVIGVTLSGPLEMEPDVPYGIAYAVNGVMSTLAVITEPGEHDTLYFSRPPAQAARPEPDAVFSFGPREREVIPLLLRDANPDNKDDVRLTLVGLPPTLAELRTRLPEWNPRATLARLLPTPVITSVLSSAREMLVTAQGDLVTQVIIHLKPIAHRGYQIVVMMKYSGTTDDYSIVQATNYGNGRIGILGCEDGNSYDFRIQYTHQDYFPSQFTEVMKHRVIGRIDPPQPVGNLQLVILSGTVARLHWDEPPELDVKFGGKLLIRHSPERFSAAWQRSTQLIATDVSAALLSINVPLLTGTYMVMTEDSSGNLSREYAAVSTDAASIQEFDVIPNGVLAEEPLFLGPKYNVAAANGSLRLMSGDFDSIADVDAIPNWDAVGLNVVNGGAYYAADPYFDMGEIRRCRVRKNISLSAELIGDLISKRTTNISTWPSISGTIGAPVDCVIEISTTSGDPASDATIWSPWTRLDVGEWVFRALKWRALLYTSDGAFGIAVSTLQVIVEEVV